MFLTFLLVNAAKIIEQAPLELWQAKVWDPSVGSKAFDEFCVALNSAWGLPVSIAAQDLEYGHPDRMVSLPRGLALDFSIRKYASWMRDVGTAVICVPAFTYVHM